MPPAPQRILFLRPDAYGDLFLFEPVPRIVRAAWPDTEVAVLIRQPYADAVPLFAAAEGIRWLTTDCNPYRQAPGDDPAALAALRDTVRAFAPDCVVAACAEQTWLESAVASFLPDARQVSLGPGLTDPLARAALDAVLTVDWTAIYPEKIPAPSEEVSEWEKNLGLAGTLLGHEAPRWWPTASVPADAAERAARIVADAGLTAGAFVACAAAGTANVQIKSWPAEHYGATLASLEREHGIRALLLGHDTERAHLETVREAARGAGADLALWTGQNGEWPVVAGLLAAARFYFGNDTGALHLAAALGRPVVPVFGGGHWPRFRPVARRSLTVVQPLPCFGCAWDCYYADAPCVRTISVASVQQALAQFLADDAERQTVFTAQGLDPGARALIDAATPRLRFQRADSTARLRQTRELTALLQTSESDRDARLRQFRSSEAESLARLRQVEELTAQFKAKETESTARLTQITELTTLLKISETDRDDRQAQIAELSALLKTSEADRDARQSQVAALTTLLKASEADRDARQTQIAELTALLKTAETDRTARGEQIEQLTSWLLAKTADCEAQSAHIELLTARLETGEAAPGEADEPGASAHGTLAEPIFPTVPGALDEPGSRATSELTAAPASGTPMPVSPGGGSRHGEHLRFHES